MGQLAQRSRVPATNAAMRSSRELLEQLAMVVWMQSSRSMPQLANADAAGRTWLAVCMQASKQREDFSAGGDARVVAATATAHTTDAHNPQAMEAHVGRSHVCGRATCATCGRGEMKNWVAACDGRSRAAAGTTRIRPADGRSVSCSSWRTTWTRPALMIACVCEP